MNNLVVKLAPGKNSGNRKESETKKTKKTNSNNVKGTKNKAQITKKRNPVSVRTTTMVALFVVTTGEKIALKAKYSGVHKNRVVTTPCYKHSLDEGKITKDRLLKFGLSACFGSEGAKVSEGINFKIGTYQFHVYHISAIDLGNKVLANPKYFFEEIKKLKRGKAINLNGKDHTITKACRLTLASIPKRTDAAA